jgi:cyclase
MDRSTDVRLSTLRLAALTFACTCACASIAAAAGVGVEQIAPRVYVISQPGANLVLMTGDDGSIVAGVQYGPLVERAQALITEQHAAPVRYAVIMEDDTSLAEADGGWGDQHVVTLIHEKLYGRMYKASHGRKNAPPAIVLKHALPALGFSEVVQLLLKSEDVHVIHARAGYTDADVIVHLEGSGVVYLGNTVTSDGYPVIDTTRNGDVNGMIATAQYFAAKAQQFPDTVAMIVPGRGPVVKGDGLRDYGDMLVTLRDRVQVLIKQGKTLAEVVAARPSASFDEKWGHGPVTPEAFVTALYTSLIPK